jgi:hypothetical protein
MRSPLFDFTPVRLTQSSTSFESKTGSGALLLLAALGLPGALFRRRFRLRLSLLRHAALLAVSEWRYRAVPAGIASTVLELLQRDKNTSIFAHRRLATCAATQDVASRRSRSTYATRRSAANATSARKIFRHDENMHGTRVFTACASASMMREAALMRAGEVRQSRGDDALSMSIGL